MEILTRTLCLLLLFQIIFLPPAQADKLQLQEKQIKAGLLYNFLKYTDWPAAKMAAPSITICVFGDDPFDGYLQPMAGRSLNQKAIALRSMHTIAETNSCHLVFVNAREQENWPKLREFLAGKNILTVSDFPGFSKSGGMIEFDHKNEHINAELNMTAMSDAGLHAQDHLLRLVTVIQQDKR